MKKKRVDKRKNNSLINNKKEKREIIEVIYTVIIAFAIISFWRGIWGLMDLYLFPHNQGISFLISLIIGILILYLNKDVIDRLV